MADTKISALTAATIAATSDLVPLVVSSNSRKMTLANFAKTLRTPVLDGMAINVKDYGAYGDNSHDDTTAFNNALAALSPASGAQPGGILWVPAGTYLIAGKLVIPTQPVSTYPAQAPIKIVGAGAGNQLTVIPVFGGTILRMTYAGTVGKFVTMGNGKLEIEGICFLDDTDGTLPFIYDTNTVMNIHDCQFNGKAPGVAGHCTQDAIVLGGRTAGYASYNPPVVTDCFQGYGTAIVGNYFETIRHCVTCNVAANNVVIDRNFISPRCGSATAGDAAFIVQGYIPYGQDPISAWAAGAHTSGDWVTYGGRPFKCTSSVSAPGITPPPSDGSHWSPAGPDSQSINPSAFYCEGVVISNNTIELEYYTYGIKMSYAQKCQAINNGMFDAAGGTLTGVRFESTCYLCRVDTSWGSDGSEVSDATVPAANMVLSPLLMLAPRATMQAGGIAGGSRAVAYAPVGASQDLTGPAEPQSAPIHVYISVTDTTAFAFSKQLVTGTKLGQMMILEVHNGSGGAGGLLNNGAGDWWISGGGMQSAGLMTAPANGKSRVFTYIWASSDGGTTCYWLEVCRSAADVG